MGKKLFFLLFIIIVFTTGCDFEVDDSEKRTYNDIVYDKAYVGKKSEGLKCRSYLYYLFNESENIVLNHIYYTCGRGTITEHTGTWDGNLNKEANLYFNIDGEEIVKKVTFDEYNMYDSDKKEYDEKDVKTTIIEFGNREYLKNE